MVEAKKDDPASADEVWENIMVGNKAAAESTEFLLQRGVTHLLNLAADRSLRFHVTPDKVRCSTDIHEIHAKRSKAALARAGVEVKEMGLRDREGEEISCRFREAGLWLRTALRGRGRVLVNCWQGASRCC